MCSSSSFLPATAVVFTMGRSRPPGRDMAGEPFQSNGDYGALVPRIDGTRSLADLQGAASSAGSIVIDKCLARIFVAAYLLTGNTQQAEGATVESIQQLDLNATRSGCLSWKAIAASITPGNPDSEGTPEEASTELPIELLRVLRLSPRLRQCFVLRVLMAMPRQYCAGLLQIDPREVDANSSLAVQQLARIVAAEATA